MNKAQQLINWFEKHGTPSTYLGDIDVDFFDDDDYIADSYDIVDQTRWSTYKSAVWKFDDGSYVEITWEEGSTEYQDAEPSIAIDEVEPYEETVIKYRAVK
jgi:hypothetical protein